VTRVLKNLLSILLGTAIFVTNLIAVSAPANAYGSVTLGSGSASNTFTAPTSPVTPSISGGQPFAFPYPGGVFEVGAPSNGSTSITVNAYKNGALDTSFNTTGSVTFTSQLATGDRSWLEMTTYDNGTRWAILDSNASTNSGYNFLYLGTFSTGYIRTITLPTTASNYTTCTNKINSVSSGTYTSYSGSFKLVPNAGFVTPVLAIDCSVFLNSAGSTYTSIGKFLFYYSGGTTIGTPATLSDFTLGGTFANGYQAVGAYSSKTLTNFGMSINPNATGSQVAITLIDGLSTDTSYSTSTAYDTTPYSNFVITRITADRNVSFTLSAFPVITAGTRTGNVVLPPRNNGTVYALQQATDGTAAIAKLLTIAGTGVATVTPVTGVTLTNPINRIAPQTSPSTTIKLASLNNGSTSHYHHLNASTGAMTQVSTFTTSGGFSYPDLLWAMADNTDGSDFYARASSTSIIRIATTTAPQAPAAPATPTAVRGDASATVSWTAPANNGSALTGYSLEFSSDSGSTWTNWSSSLASSATSETVTGLTNGTAYVFRLNATNAIGTSSWSTSSTAVTPAALPSAPTLNTLTPGAANVALTWTAPASNGGFAITDYTIEYSSNSGSTWSAFTHTASTATSITVTGLSNGTSYVFRVKAVTSVGTGTASATSAAQLVAAAPGQPNAPTIANGSTQVTASWTAPAANGCAITAYKIEYSSNAGSTWSLFSSSVSTTSSTVTGLTNGTAYVFRVSATNCMGFGASSAASISVTPNPVPSQVTGLTVTGNGSNGVTLSWAAPSGNGSAVSDYTIEHSTDGWSTFTTYTDGVSTATSYNITGLTPGTSYSFRVSAINAVGSSTASSASVAITSATVPSAISSAPTLAAAPGVVTLTWTPPANGGSALTTAEVQYSTNGGSTWSNYTGSIDTSGTAALTGLTGGQAYVFRVRTSNFFGTTAWSSTSASVTAQPAAAPGTVTNLVVAAGGSAGTASLTWTAPNSNGSAITDYTIEYSSDGGVTWQTWSHTASTGTSATVTGLTPGTNYQFRVTAVNGIGASVATTPSAPVAATAQPVASVPNNLPRNIEVSKKVDTSDGKVVFGGDNMEAVKIVMMNNVEAIILTRTPKSLTASIPKEVLGWVNVEFITTSGSIRFESLIYVENVKANQIAKLRLGFTIPRVLNEASSKRLTAVGSKFTSAKTATCVGYYSDRITRKVALANARTACELISGRNRKAATRLAVTKQPQHASVVVYFNY
jgi:titin